MKHQQLSTLCTDSEMLRGISFKQPLLKRQQREV